MSSLPPLPSIRSIPGPPSPLARHPAVPPAATVAALAAVLLAIGLSMEARGPFGFDPAAAAAGVASQLGTTLPAAALVLAATGLNVAAGLVLIRVGLGRPFWTPGEALLAGFVGATLLDIVLLGALGGTGTFRWPVLVAVHGAILGIGHLARARIGPVLVATVLPPGATGCANPVGSSGPRPLPWPAAMGPRPGWWVLTDRWPLWVVVGIAWSGLLLLQLASPVVPFVDVLPNHVAPVEHLRTFGDFASVTTTASPIYGPSRTFLGYAALLGVIDTLAMLPAALGVAAFALPGAIAVALGVHRLGMALGGGKTGAWAVLAFVLTTSFVRLPDARATVLVLPLAAWCLAEVADRVAGREPASLRRSVLLGAGLAAAILVHPVIGALTVLSVGLVLAGWPDRTKEQLVPALLAAGVLALPQLAAMTEVALPTAVALVVIPAAIVPAWAAARFGVVRGLLFWIGRLAVVLVAVAALVDVADVWVAGWAALEKLLPTIPVLAWTSVAGLIIATRRVLNPVLLGALAAGVIAATATNLVPPEGTLQTALRFEVPKTLHYWVPVVFVLSAAIALEAAWSDPRLPAMVPPALLAVFLAVVILPLRQPPLTDAYYLGERRVSETVSLQLKTAQQGYWTGYPDTRRIVAPDGLELLGAVRAEIDAGRLRASSEVLHVARSFQQWAAVPLGVFAGVIETDVTLDAEVSIHTVGGRLHKYAELERLLAAGDPYVLLEPAGLPSDARDRVVAAGYRSIYANLRGELFAVGGN